MFSVPLSYLNLLWVDYKRRPVTVKLVRKVVRQVPTIRLWCVEDTYCRQRVYRVDFIKLSSDLHHSFGLNVPLHGLKL